VRQNAFGREFAPMLKKNVLIIFGGESNEYDVSRRSAASIIENLDRDKYTPVIIGITRDGRWYLCEENIEKILADTWAENAKSAFLSPDRKAHGVLVFDENGAASIPVDVVFPAVHGQNCEDGALQGLMELSGIPYVGPRVTAAATTFDKAVTHIIAEHEGIPMAKWLLVTKGEAFETTLERVKESFGFPCFVKPANSGSSVGCSGAKDATELKSALDIAFNEDRRVIIEELVTAQEIECAVLGNDELFAPTTGEIVSGDGFYDYDSKYINDTAKLFIPALISEEIALKVRELAKKTYRALDCTGLARVDFFVKKDGGVILNEVNTLPGFTSISMFPKMMIAGGFTYKDLITKLLELAEEVERR